MLDTGASASYAPVMSFTPGSAVIGGALIGLSASLLLVVDGYIAGISGIVGGLVRPKRGSVAWRVAFVAGLLVGGLFLVFAMPNAIATIAPGIPAILVAIGGILVGFGTRLGNGCTSGHGVCGVSRGSPRSIAAVLTFMATGALATFLVLHVLPRLP